MARSAPDLEIIIEADIEVARRYITELDERAIARAAARALNDVGRAVRTQGAREIKREHPALKIGTIKRAMRLEKATRFNLSASVSTTGKPMSVLLFNATESKKRGVSARIGKGRKRLIEYHGRRAFKIEAYGGEVFVRRADKGRRVRRFRGPSMPGVFRAQRPAFDKLIGERWPKAFASRLDYEIAKLNASVRSKATGQFYAP